MAGNTMLIYLTHLKTGDRFDFEWLPDTFRYSHQSQVSQQIAPGHLDPILQFVGGSSSTYSFTLRLVGFTSIQDKARERAVNRDIQRQGAPPEINLGISVPTYEHSAVKALKRWKGLVEHASDHWATAPIFSMRLPDPFGFETVLVTNYDVDINTRHNVNKGLADEEFGDISLSITLQRARNYVARKPLSPALK